MFGKSIEEKVSDAMAYAPYTRMLDDPDRMGSGLDETSGQNTIEVRTTRQFEALLVATFRVKGYRPDVREIRDTVLHEGDHESAARLLGARTVRYEVEYFRLATSRGDVIVHSAGESHILPRRTSNLGFASVWLYPAVPSVGDKTRAAGIGYDIDRAGYEATRHNQNHRNQIAVPKSYRPGRRYYQIK